MSVALGPGEVSRASCFLLVQWSHVTYESQIQWKSGVIKTITENSVIPPRGPVYMILGILCHPFPGVGIDPLLIA